MTDLSPRSLDPGLEAGPTRALSTGDLIARVAADLSPVQSGRVTRRIQRVRMRAAVELAEVERQVLVAEARTIGEAKVRSTEQQVERLLHAERMECLADGALRYEEASRIIGLVKTEAGHSIFMDGLNGASVRYVNSVIRRSGS
jgi:hypothetical protein